MVGPRAALLVSLLFHLGELIPDRFPIILPPAVIRVRLNLGFRAPATLAAKSRAGDARPGP